MISSSNAQESKSRFDDKNDVSRVNDYANLLRFVESVRQSVAEVSWYFYFTEVNKSTGKKSIIVTTQDLDYLTGHVKDLTTLDRGLIVEKDVRELEEYVVNDSISSELEKLSEKDFFDKYVINSQYGGIIKMELEWETTKAVIYRLLKLGIAAVNSGDGTIALDRNLLRK